MLTIVRTDGCGRADEVPPGKLARPREVIAQKSRARQPVLTARELPHDTPVINRRAPRSAQPAHLPCMRGEHKFPSGVVSGETGLKAHTHLQESGTRTVV